MASYAKQANDTALRKMADRIQARAIRQRMTPAQDPNQPLGKILRLTLDGEPAPGNPMLYLTHNGQHVGGKDVR